MIGDFQEPYGAVLADDDMAVWPSTSSQGVGGHKSSAGYSASSAHALFDIVSCDDGQRFVRAPPILRVPGERSETPISGLPEIGS